MAAGFDEQKARTMLRSDDFAYIGEQTAKFLTDSAKVYAELTGKPHPFETEKTIVRNKVGTYDLRQKNGLAGLYRQARDLFAKKETADPLATFFYKRADGREVFSFDGTKKGGVIFRADDGKANAESSLLPDSILSDRRKGTTDISATPDGPMIVLDPLKTPEKLAKDFTQQLNKLHAREAVLAAQKQAGR